MTLSRDDPGRFLSFAVHEFRTPLTVVAGYLRMLLRHYGETLDEPQRKLVEEAEKSCARLSALVTDLGDLAHLDDGRLTLARQAFDLSKVLGEVAEVVHEGTDRGVRAELTGDASGVLVTGDPRRIREALGAILTGVLREHTDPTVILVQTTVDAQAGRAQVRIGRAPRPPAGAESEGWGPFNDLRGGMGFRLVLARRVIEAAGGTIASNGEGARSEVLVTLPLKGTIE